jgi:hypothetical protein
MYQQEPGRDSPTEYTPLVQPPPSNYQCPQPTTDSYQVQGPTPPMEPALVTPMLNIQLVYRPTPESSPQAHQARGPTPSMTPMLVAQRPQPPVASSIPASSAREPAFPIYSIIPRPSPEEEAELTAQWVQNQVNALRMQNMLYREERHLASQNSDFKFSNANWKHDPPMIPQPGVVINSVKYPPPDLRFTGNSTCWNNQEGGW